MINIRMRNIFYDIMCMMAISLPSLIYVIPWILNPDPSLGIDHYGGDSLLINKTFTEMNRGYFSDWYIGTNFALYPVRYTYWVILQILYLLSSNPITIIKLSFLLTFFLSIITSYAVIKKIYNKELYGIIGGLLYVYVPYHMTWSGTEAVWSLNLYYAILPLTFYYFLEFVKDLNEEGKIDYIKLLISSLILDLIIFTHPQSFLVLTVPFLIIFSVIYCTFAKMHDSYKSTYQIIRCILTSFLPIIIAFLIGAFWWTSAISQRDLVSGPDNSIDTVKEKTASFISIATLQGRAYTVPIFENFFNLYIEMIIAIVLAIVVWVSILYLLIQRKEYINQKMYWIPSVIISSIIFTLMAMGPFSPIPIYTWLYYNVPFFASLRTPDRWLSIVILCVSILFPLGIDTVIEKFINIFSRIQKNISDVRCIIYISIIILILANSWTELGYPFKNFKLNADIYQYYELLSSKQDNSRIFTIPPYSYYILDKDKNNINDNRTPYVVDPRLWTFMYGKKENFAGGSESISVKDIEEFRSTIRYLKDKYIVNLDTIYDVYGIDYIWVDKTKKERLRYHIDNSTTKLIDTGNYSLYHNNDSFPRIFMLKEDIVNIGPMQNIVEGYGNITLINSSDSSLQQQILFSNKNVREWKYAKYEDLTAVNMLDEIYGEYVISGIDPNSVDISLKFIDKDGKNYIWVNRFRTHNGTFKIPIFWFQPMNTNGSTLNVETIKSLNVGIIESSSDIESDKNGIMEIKNLKILKHQLVDVSYKKIDDLLYYVRITNTNNSKNVIVFNYAYNPNIKLRIDKTFIDGYKIFGFLNAFDVPYSDKEELEGIIEYRLGKSYYYGMIISLVTILSFLTIIFYDQKKK